MSTLMPYRNLDHAPDLIRRGEGSLVASVYGADPATLAQAGTALADSHGRVHVISPAVAATHRPRQRDAAFTAWRPGRAGGGEELGGLRALGFYHRRSAVQADGCGAGRDCRCPVYPVELVAGWARSRLAKTQTPPHQNRPWRPNEEDLMISQTPQRRLSASTFAQHLIERNATREKAAYIDDARDLTYAALADRVTVRGWPHALGVRRRGTVLLLMHDCNDWPVSFLGAVCTQGIVPVAVNTLLTVDDYAYMLEHSRAQVTLVSAALLPTLRAAMANRHGSGRSSCPGSEHAADEIPFRQFVDSQSSPS